MNERAPEDVERIAAAFADAVDAGDLAALRHVLADDCVREDEAGGDRRAGAEAVVARYAARERDLVRDYDDIRREHAVERLDDTTARIRFTENLAKAPAQWRRERRVEDVRCDAEGRIERIVERRSDD